MYDVHCTYAYACGALCIRYIPILVLAALLQHQTHQLLSRTDSFALQYLTYVASDAGNLRTRGCDVMGRGYVMGRG